MEIAYFLVSVLLVSLSGALMPGPVLAVVVAAAPRNRFAGFEAAAGHALIELPLVAAIALGFASVLAAPLAHAVVGVAGGMALVAMGVASLRMRRCPEPAAGGAAPRSIGAGLVSSLNPYFFLWWATAGAAIIARAMEWSVGVLALMYLAHVAVDVVWYGAVGVLVARSVPVGGAWQIRVLRVCAVVMIGFGLYFLAGVLQVL